MLYAAVSEMGRVRDNNEDDYYCDGRVFIVADGMGGHRGGEVASKTAIEAFLAFERDNSRMEPRQRLREAISHANLEIYLKARENPRLEGMGTTFTVALLEDRLFLGHVGDSRAYLYRDGELDLLTHDHSLVESMVREGRITRSEARHHPQRNIILRALGVSERVRVDLHALEPLAGDRFLLCSDGLTNELEDEEIREVIARHDDPERCCRELVSLANQKGGTDNITTLVVHFEDREQNAAGSARGPRKRWRTLFSRGS